MRSIAGSLSTAASQKGVDRTVVHAVCFAIGLVFTQDILDKEDIVKHNGDPTLNANVTYSPAIVQMLAPKPAKTFHDYAEFIFYFLFFLPPTFSVDFGVCEKN